jgi:hypothetical protein
VKKKAARRTTVPKNKQPVNVVYGGTLSSGRGGPLPVPDEIFGLFLQIRNHLDWWEQEHDIPELLTEFRRDPRFERLETFFRLQSEVAVIWEKMVASAGPENRERIEQALRRLEDFERGSRKGGDARRKQAEPNHKAIRKRFRELRKTVTKKTVRYVRVASEFEMSDRQIARIVDGID